jgi:DNA-binding cell septation regulator SpoVG
MTDFVVESFTSMAKNSLLGFATVRIPSGLVLHDVAVHRQGDSIWVMPPSRPMLGRDGSVMKDTNGKVRYQPIITFRDKQTQARWSAAVIEAMRQQHREVLA